jgi:SAM-dependent methyltransferase
MSDERLYQVRDSYAAAATSTLSGADPAVRKVAEAFGYTPEELDALPAEANLGLSCGNPTAFARLRAGETVVDLGCGAGIDVLLAALKVGPSGRAIGIDMTPEMIERAKQNAARPIRGQVLANVEFHLATIDRLPLPSNSVDCLTSNCVINLAPDKPAVFREIYRVLKPGGRMAVSDIALKRPLPPDLVASAAAYVGCVSGAIPIDEYERWLRDAGFTAVRVLDANKDLNVYATIAGQSGCCGPAMAGTSRLPMTECCAPAAGVHAGLQELAARYDFNDYAASVQVYTLKGA